MDHWESGNASRPTVMGLEHEVGLSIDPADVLAPRESPAAALLRLGERGSRDVVPYQYLENGARLYVDCGEHPEYATPECSTPQELLAADCAGMAILATMAENAERSLSDTAGKAVRVRVLRNNLAPNGESWGTHENYLAPASLSWADLSRPLVSHLASRVCFAGAGTIIGAHGQPHGQFRLSQRAPYVGTVLSLSAVDGPTGRPMVLARDEPLADPNRYRRLQVVCGDASMSHTATLLKLTTTMIALRLVEASRAPAVELDRPLVAFHQWSADPDLKTTAVSSIGKMRATDVQRQWLDAAERYHDEQGLPAAEAVVLPLWDAVLAGLERDPDELADQLDWVAKRRVLRTLADREGLEPDDPRLVAADLAYHDVRPDRSVFGRLLAGGRMRSLVCSAAVEQLRDHPPASTRAATRGELVRLLRATGHNYDVTWARCRIHSIPPGVDLELSDPLSPAPDQAVAMLAALREELATEGPTTRTRPVAPAAPLGGLNDWWAENFG
ncbi:MAG: proteasome accessory factor PafA2 [Acidimicrobiia bacterium]|nr:proteasome accessory factor PafA2 [Acidimicrobiia bacterium]